MKRCTKCGRTLPVDEFNWSGKYRRTDCRDCSRQRSSEYGRQNRERRNARLRHWRRDNPEAARAKDRRARLARKYRITEEQHSQLFAAFDGLCWVCQRQPATVVDHDHATGRVRGMACHGCNTVVLARVDADPDFLDRVRTYLDQPCHADVLLELANG